MKPDASHGVTWAQALYRLAGKDIAAGVSSVVSSTREMEELVRQKLDLKLENLHVLEIGPGPQLLRLRCLSAKNRVAGVDAEVIAQGWSLAPYWRMLRCNGAKRLGKTVLRKAAGLDRAYRRELEKHAGPKASAPLPVVLGDAHDLSWPEETFDFVCSFSVFEHLRDPARCLAEVVRVLKRGGGFCLGIHLYTSDSGAHDPRMFACPRPAPPYWAHLRPEHQSEVECEAYCNRWRLSQWERELRRQCPGVILEHRLGRCPAASELSLLRGRGELLEYTDEELLTVELRALWRKREELLPVRAGPELGGSGERLAQGDDPALRS
jgi:SAM-dependent methyltransferase